MRQPCVLALKMRDSNLIWKSIFSSHFPAMFKLTVCGFLQWRDLGEAIGVDVKRATGQVLKNDLEAHLNQKELWKKVIQRCMPSHRQSSMISFTFLIIACAFFTAWPKLLTHIKHHSPHPITQSFESHSHGTDRWSLLSEAGPSALWQGFSSGWMCHLCILHTPPSYTGSPVDAEK